jgi:hypothetical protein
MKTTQAPPLVTDSDHRARLVLLERGAPTEALSHLGDEVGTTIMVGLRGEGTSSCVQRVEHRIAELQHSGRELTDVVVLLSARSSEVPLVQRVAALRAAIQPVREHGPEVVFTLPTGAPQALRHAMTTLAEQLTGGNGRELHVRFQSARDSEPPASGVFPAPWPPAIGVSHAC